ncbi:MAG: alpha/beta hydrolase-fold protein [Corynebacterium sp.]|nr:alpha/beta hydrolase-fold protein [Corynebacterium sp.]
MPTSAPISGPGLGESKTINLSSGRTYILSVPADYSPEKSWPVVLAFHGWKESARAMAKYSELSAAEALVAFPQGKDSAWAPAPYATTSGSEDVQFVTEIIDTLRATYNVDDQRIYATGMSNGGGFAAYLGCQMPDVFAAVASVSAAYYQSIHADCTGEPVARLDIHGTLDPIVDYYGGTRHGARYNSVPDVMEMDAMRNRCSGEQITERMSNNALLTTWTQCEKPLQHIRLGGGHHVWPGGNYDSMKEAGTGFATDKVLDFFGIPGRPADTEQIDVVSSAHSSLPQ